MDVLVLELGIKLRFGEVGLILIPGGGTEDAGAAGNSTAGPAVDLRRLKQPQHGPVSNVPEMRPVKKEKGSMNTTQGSLNNWVKGLPQVFKLVKHVFTRIVDVDFHKRRVQVLHRQLLGEGSHKERFYGIDRCDFVGQQCSLRLASVLQEHKTCKELNQVRVIKKGGIFRERRDLQMR